MIIMIQGGVSQGHLLFLLIINKEKRLSEKSFYLILNPFIIQVLKILI